MRRYRAIRWAQQVGASTGGGSDGIFRALDLSADSDVRQFREVRMRPAVIADLMAFTHSTLQNFRLLRRVLPHDKKVGVNVILREVAEDARRQLLGCPIVESQ